MPDDQPFQSVPHQEPTNAADSSNEGWRAADGDTGEFRPLKRSRLRLYGWLLIACSVAGLTIIAVGAALAILGPSEEIALTMTAPSPPLRKIWSENELSATVKGKRHHEVVKMLGTPRRVSGDPEREPVVAFNYGYIMLDANTGQPIEPQILFVHGCATGEVRRGTNAPEWLPGRHSTAPTRV